MSDSLERRLARLEAAEEIADVVLFFASEAARYVTGTTLLVDGGVTLGDLRKAFAQLPAGDPSGPSPPG